MNEEYPVDSDSSDEDYVPPAPGAGEVLSEVDSDGDSEDALPEGEQDDRKPGKRRKQVKTKGKQRNIIANRESDSSESKPEIESLSADAKKKHADEIWASFKRDTNFKKATTNSHPKLRETIKDDDAPSKSKSNTLSVKKIFEFAGKEVTVEKEVDADSVEARLAQKGSTSSSAVVAESAGAPKRSGGLGAALNSLTKKQKLSTLDKSKLDWNRYKHAEKIEDELESYKKGKHGYLEKQDFLQRADLRRFEIEKGIRAIQRSNRIN